MDWFFALMKVQRVRYVQRLGESSRAYCANAYLVAAARACHETELSHVMRPCRASMCSSARGWMCKTFHAAPFSSSQNAALGLIASMSLQPGDIGDGASEGVVERKASARPATDPECWVR